MRIGVSQINTIPGAFFDTVERLIAQSQRAAEQQVDLLVFPLVALAGLDAVPFADCISFMRDAIDTIVLSAERFACPALVPIPVDLDLPEGTFDVMLVQDGKVTPLGSMRHGGPSAEQGNPGVIEFEFLGTKLALARSQEDLDALDDYDYAVDVVLYLSGYPFAMDDPSSAMIADYENSRFVADVQSTNAWMVGVAPVGGYGEQVFTGSSFVMAPTGELVAVAPAFEEALVVAELGSPEAPAEVEPLVPEVYDAPFHLWQALTLGIHDFVTKQGYTDVALCIDGTLGSLVLAALASDALGPLHVHALIGASAAATAPACREFVHRLRINESSAAGQPRTLDLRDLDELELAALAREHKALILSSYDKTALALRGLGDGVRSADLCPLGDVYRSDVLDMAHVRNTISPIFRRVTLAVSDCLSVRMNDGTVRAIVGEQEITRVDEILLGYIEYDRPLADLVADGTEDPELIDAVLRAFRESELSRRALPPVLTMSTRTLEEGQFPLGTRWHDQHPDGLEGESIPISEGLSRSQEKRDTRHRIPNEPDLDATLAMLRDLAEQGGFIPSNPTGLEGGAGMGEGGGPQLPGPEMMAWMVPFSEN